MNGGLHINNNYNLAPTKSRPHNNNIIDSEIKETGSTMESHNNNYNYTRAVTPESGTADGQKEIEVCGQLGDIAPVMTAGQHGLLLEEPATEEFLELA